MNNVKKYRGMMGLSQQELADELGVSRAYITLLEKSDYKRFNYETALRFANFFGCHVLDLFGMANFKVTPKDDDEKIRLINVLADSIQDSTKKKKILEVLFEICE